MQAAVEKLEWNWDLPSNIVRSNGVIPRERYIQHQQHSKIIAWHIFECLEQTSANKKLLEWPGNIGLKLSQHRRELSKSSFWMIERNILWNVPEHSMEYYFVFPIVVSSTEIWGHKKSLNEDE